MLEYTGERMVPESADGLTFYEHVQRYRFALPYVLGHRVLDIACGEGYGTAALSAGGAKSVLGVDIAPEACAHATAKYGIPTRVGSAESMPLADGEVDLVVSFETIEHLHDVDSFVSECHRVLSPGGRIVISTPNLPVYKVRAPHNTYHHHEMSLTEFRERLSKHFEDITIFGQYVPLPRWLQLRGIRRLPTAYYRIVAPHVVGPVEQSVRDNVVAEIQRATSLRDHLDPCFVRPMSEQQLEKATYLLAVATRRQSP